MVTTTLIDGTQIAADSIEELLVRIMQHMKLEDEAEKMREWEFNQMMQEIYNEKAE